MKTRVLRVLFAAVIFASAAFTADAICKDDPLRWCGYECVYGGCQNTGGAHDACYFDYPSYQCFNQYNDPCCGSGSGL